MQLMCTHWPYLPLLRQRHEAGSASKAYQLNAAETMCQEATPNPTTSVATGANARVRCGSATNQLLNLSYHEKSV